jgi:hypothetical protein
MIQVVVKFLPLSMGAADAADYIGSQKIFDDMRKAKWIAPFFVSNKTVQFDRSELETCYARVRAGEYPEANKPPHTAL